MAPAFCELILYPTTMLKVFIRCRSFLMEFFGSLMYTIISSANKDTLTSSYLNCIPLISFTFLIALAKTSSDILNRYREMSNLDLILTLVQLLWAFLHLSSCRLSMNCLYYIEICPLYFYSLQDFIMKGYWILLKTFSASNEMIT